MGATINNASLIIEMPAAKATVGFKNNLSSQCFPAVVNTYTKLSSAAGIQTDSKHHHREGKRRSDYIIIETIVSTVSFG